MQSAEEERGENDQQDNNEHEARNRALARHQGSFFRGGFLLFDFGRGHSDRLADTNSRGADSTAQAGNVREKLLLKQAIKRGARVRGIPRRRHEACIKRAGHRSRRLPVACHRHPGGKRRALICLILDRDPNGDRFQTLKPGGGIEVHALLTAMQGSLTLRATVLEIGVRGQRYRAVIATRGDNILNQPGQLWTRDIQR
jgi:hypothetical protein